MCLCYVGKAFIMFGYQFDERFWCNASVWVKITLTSNKWCFGSGPAVSGAFVCDKASFHLNPDCMNEEGNCLMLKFLAVFNVDHLTLGFMKSSYFSSLLTWSDLLSWKLGQCATCCLLHSAGVFVVLRSMSYFLFHVLGLMLKKPALIRHQQSFLGFLDSRWPQMARARYPEPEGSVWGKHWFWLMPRINWSGYTGSHHVRSPCTANIIHFPNKKIKYLQG